MNDDVQKFIWNLDLAFRRYIGCFISVRLSQNFAINLQTKFPVTSWHSYQERLFTDPIYTSLKLQPGTHQHIPVTHSQYPDSTSHIASTATSQVPSDTSGLSSYPQTYTFRHQDTSTTVVSSTDQEYPTIASPQSTLNQVHNGINLHQRRGSLQLWQFLVALLDEPTQRYFWLKLNFIFLAI